MGNLLPQMHSQNHVVLYLLASQPGAWHAFVLHQTSILRAMLTRQACGISARREKKEDQHNKTAQRVSTTMLASKHE